MLKRIVAMGLLLCLLCVPGLPARQASADVPKLSDLLPSSDNISLGNTKLEVAFTAGTAGVLVVTARIRGSGTEPTLLHEIQTAAGEGTFVWDGTIDGQKAKPGDWELFFVLRDADGKNSPAFAVPVTVSDGPPRPTMMPKEARPKQTPGPDRQLSEFPDPHTDCFWNMDIDNLDPEDPDDWPTIWAVMMQTITVLDVGPKEHVYPLDEPNADPKDPDHYTGQLTGTTQGVHVIRQEGDMSLIEAYALDGYNAPRKFLRTVTGKLIHGYVRTSLLKTVAPDQTIGLLVDKLRQRLYVYQMGKLTGVLKVSTGRPTKGQPNAETPAGEMLTDSKVGMFTNGNMYCDKAIRICDGTLIHEVPYVLMDNGGRDYDSFEQFLGRKASHGCVRVQRDENEQGMNMKWLWDHIERRTKVLIWDDQGRTLPPPDPALPIYYNPDGGKNYHLDPMCPSVKKRFLPLAETFFGNLNTAPFDKLTPCTTCNPPARQAADTADDVPDSIIGTEVDP